MQVLQRTPVVVATAAGAFASWGYRFSVANVRRLSSAGSPRLSRSVRAAV